MWMNERGDFTENAEHGPQLDVPIDDPAAELLALLDIGHWSDFFEVVPRSELGLLLVRRRDRYHSTSEGLFWDAIWALLSLHSTGGSAPLGGDTTSDIFRLLATQMRR